MSCHILYSILFGIKKLFKNVSYASSVTWIQYSVLSTRILYCLKTSIYTWMNNVHCYYTDMNHFNDIISKLLKYRLNFEKTSYYILGINDILNIYIFVKKAQLVSILTKAWQSFGFESHFNDCDSFISLPILYKKVWVRRGNGIMFYILPLASRFI